MWGQTQFQIPVALVSSVTLGDLLTSSSRCVIKMGFASRVPSALSTSNS